MNNTWYEVSIQKGDVKVLIKSTESLEAVETLTADLKRAGINVVREEYQLDKYTGVKFIGQF
jgi:hypothetical protein